MKSKRKPAGKGKQERFQHGAETTEVLQSQLWFFKSNVYLNHIPNKDRRIPAAAEPPPQTTCC